MSFIELFERRTLVEPLQFDLVEKPDPDLCWVKGCNNNRRWNRRKRVYDGKLCWGCTKAKLRHDRPVEARFTLMRDRAKRYKIPCSLTIDQLWMLLEFFPEFLDNLKDMHIDRIDATKGYHWWNVQPLSSTDNLMKAKDERYREDHIAHMKNRRRGLAVDPDIPFPGEKKFHQHLYHLRNPF